MLQFLSGSLLKRGLEQKELSTDSQIKKLKTEAEAANSFQFKGNKLQFEFNSSLLDSIDSSSPSLLEGNLTRVNQELENVKTLLNKRHKAIRFADKSSAGWTAVEEYESDELADDSEDEKKLRSAERRALSKLRARKQNRSTSHLILPGVIVLLVSLFVLGNSLNSPFEVISHFGADNHSLPINASPVVSSDTEQIQHCVQTSATGTAIEPCQAPLPLPPTNSDQVLNRLGKDEYSNFFFFFFSLEQHLLSMSIRT